MVATIRQLGVYGETGQPVGSGAIVPSAMNIVPCTGRFARLFEKKQILNGEVGRQFIMGDPQAGKLSWYVMNSAIQNAKPHQIEFHLYSFIGAGAAQAEKTFADSSGSPQPTAKLLAAYRDNNSKGRWDNDTGVAITNIAKVSTFVRSVTTASVVAASKVIQDLTYTAVTPGSVGNSITITYTGGGAAGSEIVSVVGNAVSVQIQSGVSTAAQVRTAILGSAPAVALVTPVISGTGSNAQTTVASTPLEGGVGVVGYATVPVQSVVGLVVGDLLKITHSLTDYDLKIETIDEANRTVYGPVSVALPALSVNDVVVAMYFQLVCYRRDFRGAITKLNIPQNSDFLSTEVENVDAYFVTKLKSHPLFVGEDLDSSTVGYKRLPAPNATPVFLEGGLDGAAPASTSDWASIQSEITDGNYLAIVNFESTSLGVAQSYQAFCESIKGYPLYMQPVSYQAGDWQTLRDYGLNFIRREGWVQQGLFYGWRYVPDPIGSGNDPVIQIPVMGAVLGMWVNIIYSGYIHRAVSETRFDLVGFVNGPNEIFEDGWDDNLRTMLYQAGVNIVQLKQGLGVLLRNFRSPSDDVLARDLHIHAINQCIKFTAQDNLQTAESKPNKYLFLQKMKGRLEMDILKPLFEGNFTPYCVDDETGAFSDEPNPDGTPASWSDVSGVRADRFNNPQSAFQQGDADLWVEWVPYSLLRSLRIKVNTAVQIFTRRA